MCCDTLTVWWQNTGYNYNTWSTETVLLKASLYLPANWLYCTSQLATLTIMYVYLCRAWKQGVKKGYKFKTVKMYHPRALFWEKGMGKTHVFCYGLGWWRDYNVGVQTMTRTSWTTGQPQSCRQCVAPCSDVSDVLSHIITANRYSVCTVAPWPHT